MSFSVFLTNNAANDLEEIYYYIATHDSSNKADYVLDTIEKAINTLTDLPERGVVPRELASLGMKEFREIFFKPYRIIYRVMSKKGYIFLIADGRRDMQSLLQQRLLTATN